VKRFFFMANNRIGGIGTMPRGHRFALALAIGAPLVLAIFGCATAQDPGAIGNTRAGAPSASGGGSNPQGATNPQGSGGSSGISGIGSAGGVSGAAGAAAGSGNNTGGAAGANGGGSAGAPGGVVAGASSGGASSGGAAGSGTTFSPLCTGLTTAAGAAPAKGGACTPSDPQLCYNSCGPMSIGFKSETCTASLYVEQSGCSFPPGDESCYKIPATEPASCPGAAAPPQASQPCSIAACVVCGGTGGYKDSKGTAKTGYCVCAGAAGATKWSCASSTAWPCPAGQGCI
jgi:hypothetical protein